MSFGRDIASGVAAQVGRVIIGIFFAGIIIGAVFIWILSHV